MDWNQTLSKDGIPVTDQPKPSDGPKSDDNNNTEPKTE